jgi:hopanoid biosynthesis associated protein HpnK
MNRLIINADDFGIHTEVNHAIITACQQGILTSTSLLATGPAFDEAVELARQCPKLGIGIHLCLVGSLRPVLPQSAVPSLVTAQGVVPESYAEVMKRIFAGKYNYEQVYQELDAQMAKIMATGLNITHVDSHQHLHVLPQIWPIVQTLMKKYHIHRLRIPREDYTFKALLANPVRALGRDGLTYLSKRAMKDVRRLHFTTSDYFWGMADGGNMNEQNLKYIISRLPFGIHEIMMHPGRSTAVLSQSFSWGYHWEDEFHALLSTTIRQYLQDHGIELIHYGDLP